jgi:hypothetical protein
MKDAQKASTRKGRASVLRPLTRRCTWWKNSPRTHDLNLLLEMLDGIVFILDGRVIAGSLDDVVSSEVLSELYDTPVHVHVTSDGHRFVVGA